MKQFSLAVLSVFFALGLSLIASSVSAAELDYYGIETVLERSLLVETTTTLIFDKPINHLDYNLDFNIMNLSVKTLSGTSKCSFDNIKDGSTISCDFYGVGEQDKTIKLSFSTRNAIKRVGENYEFRASYPISMPTKRMFCIIKLPPKAGLAMEVANESFFPPDGKILTDGKRIIVSWEKRNLTTEDSLNFSVLFDLVGTGGLLWDVLIVVLTTVVIIIMIVVAVYVRRGTTLVKREIKILPLLNADEKRIVDMIAKQGGEARQRLLVKESDFSKAKVSRLIKNLKERGVVDIEPISGRENKIILKIKGVE